LSGAGNSVSTYDRYTFYRLLSQLGVDSAPETGKMNLNYVNVDNSGNIVPNIGDQFHSVDEFAPVLHQRRRPDAARLYRQMA